MSERERKLNRILRICVVCAALAIILIAALGWKARASITRYQENKNLAHEIAEMMRAEGHPEDHPVILACQQWWREEDAKEEASVSERVTYTTLAQRTEYPEASYVWDLLKQAGLSDIHAAAIIGNAMSESGGQTLAINVYQDESGYWGAWAMSKTYFPDVVGKGADAQVAKILETLDPRFYDTTDVRSAAKFFSDYWERPAVWSSVRADNAEKALAYFAGG